ncbi:MAG: penicillin-binding protein 1C [Panacagrimonas sp.]
MRHPSARVRALRIHLVLGLATVVGVALLLIRVWPHPPLADRIGQSQAVFDRQGLLLRLSLAPDEQYRLWTALDQVSPRFIQALLLHEDRHFYLHPGVDPLALVRATHALLTGGARQGASTLTMQLARLYYRLDTRRAPGKLRQIALALWLEARYSKRELLEAHINLLPYGGNIQGVGTASLVYFGKSADRLSLPEALSLVLIPQAPSLRAPRSQAEPSALRAARQRLFERWVQLHPQDEPDRGLLQLPQSYRALGDLSFAAPHLAANLLAERPAAVRIQATLDLRMQRALERVLSHYVARRRDRGLRNASAMLLDWRDMGVRAVIGSADFYDADLHGQVDGTRAKRSPGSALKPFIYALAIDQGLIHPESMLKDAPTAFGPYTPENFDGAFVGPISATQALIRSRNVPAVALASQLREPSFHVFLRKGGVEAMATEAHYGLALALGGGEVTMEEMLRLYACLPNRGELRALRYTHDDPPSTPTAHVLSAEAAFMSLEMLRQNPRPDDLLIQGIGAGRPLAWKTGTSWGFRDAWTVGVFGPYVLAVWIGEFDGRSNPAFVGVHAAAPLFFHMVDALRALPGYVEPAVVQPPQLRQVEVCAASGDLPNADCPQRKFTSFIPGVSPIRLSQVHRRVPVDMRSGRQACPPFDPRSVRWELHEFWSSDLMRLFAQAGTPRHRPPPPGDCAPILAAGATPQIVSPREGVSYSLRAAQLGRESLTFNAHAEGDARTLFWFVDESFVGASAPGVALAWVPSRPGRFQLSAVDEYGRVDQRELHVEVVP